MNRSLAFILAFVSFSGPLAASAQETNSRSEQRESFDYWQYNRQIIQRGVQAILMCNGLFTSDRTLEQVFDQELRYLRGPIGTADGGDYVVDWNLRAVAVGSAGPVPTVRAAFREGLGCVSMPPDQTFDDIDALPELLTPPLAGDPALIPWPDGDLLAPIGNVSGIDFDALQAASDWTFDRVGHGGTEQQTTLSLIVVHKGQIVHERYADGVEMRTKTRTWSTAKSIAVTLIGMMVDEGRMSLDESLALDWLPEARSDNSDPRHAITLRHVLNMSSGLETIDNRGMEYATGSGLSYWAGACSVNGARSRALIREPGTNLD